MRDWNVDVGVTVGSRSSTDGAHCSSAASLGRRTRRKVESGDVAAAVVDVELDVEAAVGRSGVAVGRWSHLR